MKLCFWWMYQFFSFWLNNFTESVAYEFGSNRGLIQYTFPAGKQPDTEEDFIAFGFITLKPDAVLLRIESSTTQDYMELEIVIEKRLVSHSHNIKLNCCLIFRLRVIYLWFITLDHMTCHLGTLVLKLMTIIIMLYGFRGMVLMQPYNWMIIMFNHFIHKVNI